jgi:ubiquinone/menaquinone biosynthesis C-methylase UbiE
LAAKVPNIPLLQFDLTRCPLPEATVDVAVLLNVLEHIDDHEAAVTELYRILRPNGAAIIEVPAGSSLYDVYDRVLMHHRRYDMTSLVCLLEQVGFTIERRTHLGFALYPAFYLAKRLNQLRYSGRGDLDERELVARMISATHRSSRMMNFVMRAELALEPYIYFPVGVRCLATCRKPA